MHHHAPHNARYIAACLAILVIMLLLASRVEGQTTITVTPGENIAAVINAAPQNAVISILAGTYPVTSAINPKSGQTITGDGLVILTGARTLTAWTSANGLWTVGNQQQHGKRTGNTDWNVCQTIYPRCNYPEDVFLDRQPLRHMQALELVKPGCKCYYFDYDRDTITISENPSGRLVQTSVTPQAITSSASNVTLNNLTIEMFASPTQDAAVQANGNGWQLTQITGTLNHGAAVLLRGNSSMRDSDISNNGQLGGKVVGLSGGQAVDTVIDNSVCNWNNYSGVDQYFEAGCMKAVRTTRLHVTNNHVVGNLAKGLWTDIDNRETYYAGNHVEANLGNGIYHEISQSATITGNNLICNGTGGSGDGGYFSAINATNTVDVLITNNYIEMCIQGNGISIRGDGSRPEHPSDRNTVVGNTVVARNGRGLALNASTVNNGVIGAYSFSGNDTVVLDAAYKHWAYGNTIRDFAAWSARFVGEVQTVGIPTPTPQPIPPSPTASATIPAIATETPVISTMTPDVVPTVTSTPPRRFVIRFSGEVIIEVIEP